MDYRKLRAEHASIHIDRAVVERVERFKFLVVCITKELTWSTHTHIREEGRTMPLPPHEAEKILHGPSDLQKVIQLHH